MRPDTGSHLVIRTGLVDARPADLVVYPVLFEGEPLGVIEFASMVTLPELHLAFLDRLVERIGVAVQTIQANRRTEELLAQSQRLARELQEQSAELQRTNAELEEKAALLSEQKGNIETQNREIELARAGLEEKAQQLAQASQYKSEFLANISHELRTPLNSMLVLSRLLSDNPDQNLTARQTEFARTIHGAGSDLLALIDDILDLSKIEAGRMDVEPSEVSFADLQSYVEQAFGVQAEEKGLRLSVSLDPRLPATMTTDAQRLQQILRNLLSNAVKFTAAGSVTLSISLAEPGSSYGLAGVDTGAPDGGVHRHRHRRRHPGRQAVAHLRGLPAGRRHDQPPLRRHRARPVDQPAAGPAARRGDLGGVDCGLGLGVHAVPARPRRRASPARPRGRCRRPIAAGRADQPVPVTARAGCRRRRGRPRPRARRGTCAGRRCSSSTTTCATCSRSPARWRCTA